MPEYARTRRESHRRRCRGSELQWAKKFMMVSQIVSFSHALRATPAVRATSAGGHPKNHIACLISVQMYLNYFLYIRYFSINRVCFFRLTRKVNPAWTGRTAMSTRSRIGLQGLVNGSSIKLRKLIKVAAQSSSKKTGIEQTERPQASAFCCRRATTTSSVPYMLEI